MGNLDLDPETDPSGLESDGPSVQVKIGADETRDETLRVCAFRRCGSALPPVSGRGNRARFCQDGKVWGPRSLTCRDAEAAFVGVDSLRDTDAEIDDTSVEALGEQIDRVLDPARALVEALTGIDRQLETTVVNALAERDIADTVAVDQRRLRGLAEAAAEEARSRTADAEQVADVAVRERASAERDRDAERQTRIEADQARQRAEGRMTAVQDELTRVVARAEAAIARAADLDRSLAAATADLAALRAALDEERSRTEIVAERAETFARKRIEELAELDARHRAQLDSVRTDWQRQFDDARAETERIRAAAEHELAATRTAHERSLGELHTTVNALNRELGAADHVRADAVTRAQGAHSQLTEVAAALERAFGDGGLPEELRDLAPLVAQYGALPGFPR
jgi:chromosome segregation ATPase